MADQIDHPPSPDAPVDAKPRVSFSRREFARRAAVASAVASLVPVAAAAANAVTTPAVAPSDTQNPPPPPAPAAGPPQNQMPGAPKLSVASQSEADARFQAILVLYGSRFSDEQKNDLHRLCAVVQPSLDHIRAYKIENGGGPALYLKPAFEREKKPKAAVSPSTAKSAPGAIPKKP
jgi:hypothetical protein